MPQGRPAIIAVMLGVGATAVLTAAWPLPSLLLAAACTLAVLGARSLRVVPKLALFAILAMVPLDYVTKLGGTLTVTKILFPPAFALLVVDRTLRKCPFAWGAQAGLVAAFGLSVALSFLVNPATPFALHSVGRYLGVLLLFYLALNVLETEDDMRALFATLVASCVASAVLGTAGLLLGRMPAGMAALMPGEHAGRLMGLSSANPNTFASYLLVAAMLAGHFLFSARRRWVRVFLLLTVFLAALGIVFSLSRAATLVSAVCGALLLVRVRRRAPWRRTALVVGLLVVCLLPLIPGVYYERMASLVFRPELDQSLQSRQSFNRVAVRLFAESPILGVGPGNFSERFMSEEYRYLANTFGYWRYVHNQFLAVACQMGLVGLLLYAAILARAWADLRYVVRSAAPDSFMARAAEALELALLSFVLNGLFLTQEHEKYLWVLVAASAALAAMRRRAAAGGGRATGEAPCSATP